jgi:branched-chain amino acid transport system ATP-binding protein
MALDELNEASETPQGVEEAPARAVDANAIFEAQNVTMRFGGLVAVNNVNFVIPRGSIVSLIGPNGAGKTTFFNMVTGLYKPTSGQLFFEGKDITRRSPSEVMEMGIARTFQNIRLFANMTALENVLGVSTADFGPASSRAYCAFPG